MNDVHVFPTADDGPPLLYRSDAAVPDPPLRTPFADQPVPVVSAKASTRLGARVHLGHAVITLVWTPEPRYRVVFRFEVDRPDDDAVEWEPGTIIQVQLTDLDREHADFEVADPLELVVEHSRFQTDLFGTPTVEGTASFDGSIQMRRRDPPAPKRLRLSVPNCFLAFEETRTVTIITDDQRGQGPRYDLDHAALRSTIDGVEILCESLGPMNHLERITLLDERALDSAPAGGARAADVWGAPTSPRFSYVVSVVIEIRAPDGSRFSQQEVDGWADAINWFFTVAGATWNWVLRIDELDAADVTSGVRWCTPRVAPHRDLASWWPRGGVSGGAFGAALGTVRAILMDSFARDWFELAVSWYVSAIDASDPRSRLVLTQAALELLSWVHLVEEHGMSTDGFRRLNAADKIRLLLQDCDIDTGIPPALTALYARARGTGLDGIAHVVEARNRAVHPPKHSHHLRSDGQVLDEASTLGLQQLEGVLLHRIGWSGPTWDRVLSRDVPESSG